MLRLFLPRSPAPTSVPTWMTGATWMYTGSSCARCERCGIRAVQPPADARLTSTGPAARVYLKDGAVNSGNYETRPLRPKNTPKPQVTAWVAARATRDDELPAVCFLPSLR